MRSKAMHVTCLEELQFREVFMPHFFLGPILGTKFTLLFLPICLEERRDERLLGPALPKNFT